MQLADLLLKCSAFAADLKLYAMTGDGVRFPIVRVGHHHTTDPEHPEAPVELFTSREQVPAMKISDMTADLGNHASTSIVRVAVPTDKGHHRILTIYELSVNVIDGEVMVDLDVEHWENQYQVIRADG